MCFFSVEKWGEKDFLDFKIVTFERRGAHRNAIHALFQDQTHLEHEWNVCVCINECLEHGNNSIIKHIHKLSSSKCKNS